MQVRLALLQLLVRRAQLLLQEQVLEPRALLDLEHGAPVAVVQLLALLGHHARLLAEELVLPAQRPQPVLQHQHLALRGLQLLLLLRVLLQLLGEPLHVLLGLLQRLAHALVLLRHLQHALLVGQVLLAHLVRLLLEALDEVEVVVGDVVVVVLDLREGLLVLGHEQVHVLALALLEAPRLLRARPLQPLPRGLRALLARALHLEGLALELLAQQRDVPVVRLLQGLQVVPVAQLLLLYLQLQRALVHAQLRLRRPVVILRQLQRHLPLCLILSDLILVLK
mmetsp:Transcript_27162/g.47246  ORF Transcript_27162/g.47246 Transcript_27162/m.47246 type:complete len:281 (+) Transcript_27162:1129-1971(+)